MARQKKDGVFINYYIDKNVKEMLDEYCEDVGQTNTLVIERILRGYLENYQKEKEAKECTIQTRKYMEV